ncbi:hypothetical protein FQN57_003693 [Myotisia sp. PD_48]|nr:hypothetical protein FQN57_003693 [Myotisia sp. PD_48]
MNFIRNMGFTGRSKMANSPDMTLVVLKFHSSDTLASKHVFLKEIQYGQQLKNSQYIRNLLDVIDGPDARDSLQSFGLSGVRKIMKDVLKGVEELHLQCIIHLDGNSAKLSDLGSTWKASPPSVGIAQPMPYGSPETLFGLQWSKEVDIWGWGMVYLHMIQAYLRPDIWGLNDRFPEERAHEATQSYERRIASDIFHNFQLRTIPYYHQCREKWPVINPEEEKVTLPMLPEYLQFPSRDKQLLERVLDPDPRTRSTATDLLGSGLLD